MSIIGKIGSWFGFPRKEAVQKTGMENQNGKDDEDGMTFDEVLKSKTRLPLLSRLHDSLLYRRLGTEWRGLDVRYFSGRTFWCGANFWRGIIPKSRYRLLRLL